MKIVYEKERLYESLEEGDIFTYNGKFYMLTNSLVPGDANRKESVNLQDGRMACFGVGVRVATVNGELLIR